MTLEHQVCQFHLGCWVGLALHELKDEDPEDYHEVITEVKHLVNELPTQGGSRLFELWKRTPVIKSTRDEPRPPSERLLNLIIRLSENWHRYRVFDWQPDVPWTNNTTEQVIGRGKVRSVWGYTTRDGMLNGFMLACSGVS